MDKTAKSPEAFRTISEVSDILDVPQHVLRFWEGKFSQIKPMKRGGNRRYYRPEDLELLRAITHLLYTDGYTIKGVQKLLRENGVRATVNTHIADHGAFRDDTADASASGDMSSLQMDDGDGEDAVSAALDEDDALDLPLDEEIQELSAVMQETQSEAGALDSQSEADSGDTGADPASGISDAAYVLEELKSIQALLKP